MKPIKVIKKKHKIINTNQFLTKTTFSTFKTYNFNHNRV